jgi:DNA-binding GntR family transcriptional regulator
LQSTNDDRSGTDFLLPTYKRAVYRRLRDMITEFELPPGLRLVEADLARHLNVSKTPVREALAMLEQDGLVDSEPYHGASVRWLYVREMQEQAFLVDALEVPTFPLVVGSLSRSDFAAIGRVINQLKRARQNRDGRQFRHLTGKQHELMFRSIGFPRLQKIIATVVGPVGLRYDRAFLDSFDDAWDLSLNIMVQRYEALKRGDAGAAANAVVKGHAEQLQMNLARVKDPLVAIYFESNEAITTTRTSAGGTPNRGRGATEDPHQR